MVEFTHPAAQPLMELLPKTTLDQFCYDQGITPLKTETTVLLTPSGPPGHRTNGWKFNGVVLSLPDLKVRSLPPTALEQAPLTGAAAKRLASALKDREAVCATDGTLVTLYRATDASSGVGRWVISTRHGATMNEVSWMNGVTYDDVLDDLAPELFGHLDPARCYTFVVRHHAYHPLEADPQNIWFVQSVEVATGRGTSEMPAAFADCGVSEQPRAALRYDEMVTAAETALERAGADVGSDPSGLRFNYGYIIWDPAGGRRHHIESTLGRAVRTSMYDRFNGIDEHQLEAQIMRGALNLETAQVDTVYEQLYPQLMNRLRECRGFVWSVLNAAVAEIVDGSGDDPALRAEPARMAAGAIARTILEDEEVMDDFDRTDRASVQTVVRGYIYRNRWVELFTRAFVDSREDEAVAGA